MIDRCVSAYMCFVYMCFVSIALVATIHAKHRPAVKTHLSFAMLEGSFDIIHFAHIRYDI